MKIALIDYGAGNLFSVERALKFTRAEYYLATKPEQILKADKLVLPGVGAFCNGIEGLRKNKLNLAVKTAVNQDKPILGICLGMQLLMEVGLEFGRHQGLRLIKGTVEKLKTAEKLPHIGWNQVKKSKESRILSGIRDNEFFYFVHSFIVRPKNKQVVAATTNYGADFCSVIEDKNIFGTQFHPEKSSRAGLKIYQNFTRL